MLGVLITSHSLFPSVLSRGTGDRASVASTDGGWARRQTIKRGQRKDVKLVEGNFITDYAVPTAVRNAVEGQYLSEQST